MNRIFIRSALCLTAVAGLLAFSSPVMAADDTSQAAQIKELQAEVKMLQQRLDAMASAQNAAAQNASAPNAAGTPGHPVNPNAYAANAGEPNMANGQRSADAPAPAAPAKTGSKMKLTFGGFIDTTGIYRTKNESADTVTNFNTGIPFKNSSNSRENEFRGSARSTRLSLLASGSPDESTNLLAYVESDFLAAASNSNNVETNSYAPRLRQAYVGYERKDLGTNLYAGQMWNLATLYKAGLSPRSESIPTTIEIGTLPGFTYVRGPELRLVKTFDENKFALGLAASTPQLNVGGANLTGGGAVTVSNPGSASTYSSTMSLDTAPDLTAKLAWDPGFGHYEVYGLARWFRDVENATQQDNTSMGGGIGAGTVIPVIDKKLDFQANVLAGQGVGRYGPALLPDVAVKPDLSLKPLNEVLGSVGLTAHPIPLWDVYLFGGYERVSRYNTANPAFGYGDTALSNASCYTPGAATCNAVTKSISEVTLGLWHDMYKGDYGDLKIGAQNELIRRDTFEDAAGINPHAYEDVTMLSLRYFPF